MTMLLVLPAGVLALGTETFGNDPAVKQPEWAEGIVDVVNLKSRVYSQWVNGNENFFYRGNAQALNEALQKYAAVQADVRQLILMPGAGKTQSFGRKPVDFDWQLHVPSGIYKAVAKRNHAVMTVFINATKPQGLLEGKLTEKLLGDLENNSFQTREQAEQELRKLGKDGKRLLRQALKARPGPEARRRIEGLLEKLRDFDVTDLEIPKGITVISVDDLLAVHLKGLKDKDSTICGMAIQDLSGLFPFSDQVVPALTEMLKKEKNEYIRRVAAACLAHVGVKAKSAVPALREGLDDPDANVRNAFQTAIDQIENAKEMPGQKEEAKKQLSILKEINEFKKAAGRQ
ncbi:MAG TPA: HEAT repeat domain-containing protein [Gemmataceae bacterium]|nr:HEAT repeat domain-containing protein [Gemmataceae bacterium]